MVKKVYFDNESEMTIKSTEMDTFVFEVGNNDPAALFQYQFVELHTEDVLELINDLQYYINNQKKKNDTN